MNEKGYKDFGEIALFIKERREWLLENPLICK